MTRPEQHSHDELDGIAIEQESGAGVLGRVEGFLARFIAYPSEHARVAHTLWIAHAHLMDSWFTTPRLAFMSAEKESGKTRALEVTELLVPDPLLSINMSSAAIVRKVAEGGVTILYDEVDALFGNASREEANVDVRSILNGGYRRGAKVHRCAMRGKTVELEELPAFAPVALAGLRTLPDTLASRSVFIHMQRRAPDEQVEQFRLRKIEGTADQLRRALAAWCAEIADDVADAEPDMPAVLVDRAAECWEPLIAVADVAGGGDWPERARDAAKHLVAGAADDTMTPGVELLEHIREAFGADERLWTETLLQRLHDRPESPWADIRGKPLNDRGLATRLRRYGIKSKDIKIDGQVRKGYHSQDFWSAWQRYLAPSRHRSATSATSATKLNSNNKKVAEVAEVADKTGETAASDKGLPADVAEAWGIQKAGQATCPQCGGEGCNWCSEQDATDAREERAAILEHDAGLSRDEAERQAGADLELPAFLDRRQPSAKGA